jgi:putative tricarboxylic transport membrane protein
MQPHVHRRRRIEMISRVSIGSRSAATFVAIALFLSACSSATPTRAPVTAGPTAAPTAVPATPTAAPFAPADVEIVVHSGPGGGNDTLAREIAKILQQEGLASTLYPVNNQEGGSGAVAMAYMNEAAGDPNTWAVHSVTWVATPLTLEAGAISFHDLTPIAQMVEERAVLAVRADSPYQTLQDLLDAAATTQLVQVGGSLQALDNVNATLLKKAAGVDWSFLPVDGGGERTAALLGGDADLQIEGARDFIELVAAGELRILATFSAGRTSVFPDVPTVAEATDFDPTFVVERRGVLGPPEMPAEAVAYWTNIIKQMMDTDAWKTYSAESGFSDVYGGPDVHLANLTATEDTLRAVFAELDAPAP